MKEDKDQELIQSSTTPYTGHRMCVYHVLGKVCFLVVSIPDLCLLSYFYSQTANKCYLMFVVGPTVYGDFMLVVVVGVCSLSVIMLMKRESVLLLCCCCLCSASFSCCAMVKELV